MRCAATRNQAGGFGQASNPTRAARPVPDYVETAFQALATVATVDRIDVLRACDFLARSAAGGRRRGRRPTCVPDHRVLPRAGHWTGGPTSPVSIRPPGWWDCLYQLDVEHPGGNRRPRYCWERLEAGELPDSAHTLSERSSSSSTCPSTTGLTGVWRRCRHFDEVSGLHLDPETPGYGTVALALFAPTASSRWRRLFTMHRSAPTSTTWRETSSPTADGRIAWEPPSDFTPYPEWPESSLSKPCELSRPTPHHR